MFGLSRTVITALMLCASVRFAAAAPCESGFAGTVSEGQARARAERLQHALARNRGHMRAWSTTWLSLYGTAALVQTGLAISADDRDDKAVFGVGAARAAIAASAVVVLPVRTDKLALSGDPCADLASAEAVLRANVRLHAKGRTWLKHAGVVALNLAAFLTLGLGYDQWQRGAIGAGIGVVVGEIQIFTQPMGSRDILGAYQSDALGAGQSARLYLTPTMTEDSVGIALGGVLW